MAHTAQFRGIATELSLEQFRRFVLPHLTVGRPGLAPKLSLHALFIYILKLLYLGCQLKELGRQKRTPNKATVRLAAKLTEAAERATSGLSPSEIASMMPLPVILLAMRLELQGGQWRLAASIAEKAAPYLHAKMASRAEEGGDRELTIKVMGGLPE